MSESAERPLQRLGRAYFRRPVDRLDLLIVVPVLLNFLWVLDVAPGGATGSVLTELMYLSAATWGIVRFVGWRRRRMVHS